MKKEISRKDIVITALVIHYILEEVFEKHPNIVKRAILKTFGIGENAEVQKEGSSGL